MNCNWGAVDNYTWGEVDDYTWGNLTICQKVKALVATAVSSVLTPKKPQKRVTAIAVGLPVSVRKTARLLTALASSLGSAVRGIPTPVLNALQQIVNCIKATWS